ncbi:MAG: hypothetical protein IPO23_13270 [Flavobacterium sp.]|nr:hypothetical protein [Flavobacterium sp.]
MTTKSANTKEVYVKIDWRDFDNYKYLEDVPITIIERTTPSILKMEKLELTY